MISTATNLLTVHPFTIVQKMKSIVRLLTAGFLMCLATVAQAQVVTSFTPASQVIPAVGQTFTIDLMVTGFTNVVTAEFPIVYDSTILKLEAISTPFHPSFKTTLINDPNGNNVFVNPNGKLTVAWEANLQTLPNGITLTGTKKFFTNTAAKK